MVARMETQPARRLAMVCMTIKSPKSTGWSSFSRCDRLWSHHPHAGTTESCAEILVGIRMKHRSKRYTDVHRRINVLIFEATSPKSHLAKDQRRLATSIGSKSSMVLLLVSTKASAAQLEQMSVDIRNVWQVHHDDIFLFTDVSPPKKC